MCMTEDMCMHAASPSKSGGVAKVRPSSLRAHYWTKVFVVCVTWLNNLNIFQLLFPVQEHRRS